MQIKQTSTDVKNPLANKYLYNGKELQTELGLDWYDYDTRFYDPSLARFGTIDLLSESYYFQSPFVYASNNPIRFMDIYGMGPGENDGFFSNVWNGVKKIGEGFSELPKTIGDGMRELDELVTGDGENWLVGIAITTNDPKKVSNESTGFTADNTYEVKEEDFSDISLAFGVTDKKPPSVPRTSSQRKDENNSNLTYERNTSRSSKESMNNKAENIVKSQNDVPSVQSSPSRPEKTDSVYTYTANLNANGEWEIVDSTKVKSGF